MFKKLIFIIHLNNNWKKFFLVLFFFNFLANTSAQNLPCNKNEPLLFEKENNISKIEIIIDNKKKWTKNSLNLLLDFNSNSSKSEHRDWYYFNISNKYKKKFKSNIRFFFQDNNLVCEFKAEVRITGDLWWHLNWDKGSVFTSMHVKILNGNINNITNFKLILPEARESAENEIFVSNFFRSIGYLSPKTFLAEVELNQKKKNYIFQEDLKKEFLEIQGYPEGPILEGDERFTIDLNQEKLITEALSMSRISNSEFAKKNEVNLALSINAVSILNSKYLEHHESISNSDSKLLPADILKINPKKSLNDFNLNYKNDDNFFTYVALIYALDAHHNLSFDDLRFYFDPHRKILLPIYYDGKSNILDKDQKIPSNQLNDVVPEIAKLGYRNAIYKIKNLNKELFLEDLNKYGLKLDENQLNQIINLIKNRLNIISNSKSSKIQFNKLDNYFSKIIFDEKRKKFENIKLVFINYENKSFSLCDLKIKNCEIIEPKRSEFNLIASNIISQNFTFFEKNYPNSLLYVHNNVNYNKFIELDNYSNKIIKDNFNIIYNSSVIVESNNEEKKIIIKQTNNDGRVIISGNSINEWSINFEGRLTDNLNTYQKNYDNLTGCVTFIDIKIIQLNFFAKNSPCEDAVNFIRVSGVVKNLEVVNSNNDAVDMDFSNIKINKATISLAGNDCFDVSYGNYFIEDINLESCGDKGVSIGEKSKTYIENISVTNSIIGLASKDSSHTEIKNFASKKTEICLAAYKKKQEFFGGYIKFENINCDNSKKKVDFDEYSLIKNDKVDFSFININVNNFKY